MFAKTNLCSKNETQLGLLFAPDIVNVDDD